MTNINTTFTVCGITTDEHGDSKVRWTKDLVRRVKLFAKQGYNRVDLVDLPKPMTKLEALDYIESLAQFQNSDDLATIAEARTYRMIVKAKAEGTHVARPRGRPRKNPVGEVVVKSSKRGVTAQASLQAIAARSKQLV